MNHVNDVIFYIHLILVVVVLYLMGAVLTYKKVMSWGAKRLGPRHLMMVLCTSAIWPLAWVSLGLVIALDHVLGDDQ